MVDEQLFEALAKVRDNLNGAAMALDEFIQQKSKVVLRSYDVSKITWAKRTGQKGDFELCDAISNKDSSDYKALLEDLNEHKGQVSKDGLFYWLFTDGKTIGRKSQTKKA